MSGGKCAACTAESRLGQRQNDSVYASKRWKALRRQVLREEPWCATGCGRPTAEIDHIVPITVAPERKYDRTNAQGLCKPCHSAKTAREVLHRD